MSLGLLSELRELGTLYRELRRYDKNRLGYIDDRRQRDGKNFYLDEETVIITDGPTAKRVLGDTNRTNYVGAELFTSRDPVEKAREETASWMPARKAIHRSMKRTRAVEHAETVVESFEAFLDSVSGRRVDVTRTMRLASGAINCGVVLGDAADGAIQPVNELVDATLPLMNSSRGLPSWAPTPRVRHQRASGRRLRAVMASMVDRRFAEPRATPQDILDELVADPELSRTEVAVGINVSLLASFGAPGVAAAWALLELKRAPELEAAAREAANAVTDFGDIAKQAPLISAIVQESLRLYPAAWLISRLASEPTEIGGRTAPAGANLEVCLYSVHRDTDEWDDASAFLPERWLAPREYRRGTFLPFGGGERACVGASLGLVELLAMMVVFLRRYDLDQIAVDETPAIHTMLVPREFTGRISRI